MTNARHKAEEPLVTIYDGVYDLPDCRGYYRDYDAAGFQMAHFAVEAFERVADMYREVRAKSDLQITDFASGYGIVPALMRHQRSLGDVLARYRDSWFDTASPDEAIAADRTWYHSVRKSQDSNTYGGIDVASNALAYAKAVGIIDRGFAEDLQNAQASEDLQHWLGRSDLVLECGSFAHMLTNALEQILQATSGQGAWIATTPVRGNDRQEALDMMRDYGHEVTALPIKPFPHRRFVSADEQALGVANARARGHDTAGYEESGMFYAQVLLARPRSE